MSKYLRLERWFDNSTGGAVVSFDNGSGYEPPVTVTLVQFHVLSHYENEYATVVLETEEVFYPERGSLITTPQIKVEGDF